MTQNEMIRKHLEAGKPITPMDALNLFGCFRLGARIFELRKQGMDIQKTVIRRGNKNFAQYRLK